MKRICTFLLWFVFMTGHTFAQSNYNQNVYYDGSTLWTEVRAIHIIGDYAYCLYFDGLIILNVSDPVTPVFVSKTYCEGDGNGLFISGNYAYVASGVGGLHIIDISNPQNPTRIGGYNMPEDQLPAREVSYRVFVEGNYAYVTTGNHGLQIIDVSNPTDPTLVLNYFFTDIGKYPLGIFIVGNYAYLTCTYMYQTSSIDILDITNPSAPVEVTSYMQGGEFEFDLYVSGNNAYSCLNGKFEITDFTNPSNPIEVGSCPIAAGSTISDLSVVGQYVYIIGESGLQIVNVIDPGNPYVETEGYNPGKATAVSVNNGYAYLANGMYSLEILDITNPQSIQLASVKDIPYWINNVFVANDIAYVVDDIGLYLVNVSNLNNPQIIGNYTTPGLSRDVVTEGNYAYVADGESGLKIIDVSNPSNLALVGSCNTPGDANHLVVIGNFAYMADGPGGLQIIDISNPAIPHIVGESLPNGYGFASDICIIGDYACISVLQNGMKIIDISDPANPFIVAGYSSGSMDQAEGICKINENTVCLADGWNGLHIIDISDPTNPVLIYNYHTNFLGYDLYLQAQTVGDYIYAINWSDYNIEILNISDLTNPILAGRYVAPYNNPRGCFVVDNGETNRIYLADTYSMQILTTSPLLSVEEEPKHQSQSFLQNYPNPFNQSTTFIFSLPSAGYVNINIYNIMGEKIATLIEEDLQEGDHQIKWNGTDDAGNSLPGGVYFCTLKTAKNTNTIKLLLNSVR